MFSKAVAVSEFPVTLPVRSPLKVADIVFVLGTYFNPESVFNAWLPLALLANKIYLEAVLEFSAEVETADAVAAFPVVL